MATSNSLTAAQLSAQQMAANNALAANLLATATGYYVRQPSVSVALGQAVTIPMPNSGIMVGIDLDISTELDITAAMTPSPVGAYGLISNVTTTDWYGNTRHNVSATIMNGFNSYIQGRPYNRIASSLNNDTADLLYNLPTAVASSAELKFSLRVPLVQPGTLNGALLTQTSNGTCSITLQTAQALVGGPDAPYTAGTATAGNITITPYFRFLMPTSFEAKDLPLLSLSTAYSINNVQIQNLVVGTNQQQNFPPARTILAQILDYVNGSERNFGSDLNSLSIIVNGATPLKQWSPQRKLTEQRNWLGADDIPGRYYFDYRRQPIDTQVFGSYAMQVNPSLVNTGAHINFASEMVYPMGVPLPGLAV
jgi:hypothetical protein